MRLIFLTVLILAIMAECLLAGPFLAYVNTEIVQGIVNHGNFEGFICILFALFVLTALFNGLQTLSQTHYKKYLTINTQNRILRHIYDLKDYSALNPGEIFAHIDQNAEVYCSERIEIIKKSVKAFCLIVFSGIYIFRISFGLMVFSYALAGAMIALNYVTTTHVGTISKSLNEKSNELVKYRWEMIRNSEAAATLSDEKVLKKYLEINQEVYQLSIALSKKKLFSSLTKRYGYLILLASVSIFGGILSLNHVFTLAELFGIIVLLPGLTGSLLDVPKILTDYSVNKGLKKSIDRIFLQEQYAAAHKTDLQEKVSHIGCFDVSFSYKGREVLCQFTFQFYPASVYLITGASGCGKSTLLRLLCRSLLPSGGSITMNSIPLAGLSRESLWKYIFYAPQNSVIFPTTLGKNITCNQKEDMDKIRRCLQNVNLRDFRIGVHEFVDDEALSAGEKQKIAFARALYQESAVLLMDEPTSAMDPASEEICMASLYQKAHKEQIIVILVSHNLSCGKYADLICKMTDGKLEGELM